MGRAPSGIAPIQSIKIVRGKHLEIIRRLIAGESQKKIAFDLGMSEGRLSVICNSPLFKRKYAELESEVKARFIEKTASIASKVEVLQVKAVDVLEHMLTNSSIDGMKVSPALKRDVALDILDLGGNGKKGKDSQNKGDAMSDVVSIISQGFEVAKQAMLAAKELRENGRDNRPIDEGYNAIDITPVCSNDDAAMLLLGEITDDDDPINVTPMDLDSELEKNISDNGSGRLAQAV
jgi:hypothetical protein